MDPYCQQQLRLLGEPDEFAAGLHAVPIHTNNNRITGKTEKSQKMKYF